MEQPKTIKLVFDAFPVKQKNSFVSELDLLILYYNKRNIFFTLSPYLDNWAVIVKSRTHLLFRITCSSISGLTIFTYLIDME
jgi:hypothetical protein